MGCKHPTDHDAETRGTEYTPLNTFGAGMDCGRLLKSPHILERCIRRLICSKSEFQKIRAERKKTNVTQKRFIGLMKYNLFADGKYKENGQRGFHLGFLCFVYSFYFS